ncbi:MAG: hypothetical protein GXO36_00905 [Chloroflexi bacterium]|nr:hypothetical protein [Chloroflexota bacterium]
MDAETRFEFAQSVARHIGAFLLAHYRLQGTAAHAKADHTLVSQADTQADVLVRRLLRAADPEAALLTEEGGARYPEDARGAWIVDPLDGTHNFVFGLPLWGVSVAYVDESGYPSVAAAYFPALQAMYSAWRGHGAWLNGRRIHVRRAAPEHGVALLGVCWPSSRPFRCRPWPWKVRAVGSGVWQQALVAQGATLAAVDCAPRLWDAAAGVLLVQEAGGVVQAFEGPSFFPLVPGQDYRRARAHLIAAGSPETLARVLEVLTGSS